MPPSTVVMQLYWHKRLSAGCNIYILPAVGGLGRLSPPAADPYLGPRNHLNQFYLHLKSQLRSSPNC